MQVQVPKVVVNEMNNESLSSTKMISNMKCQRVKVDEPFARGLEDDATEIQHLLAEPKPDHASVDSVFCFGKDNLWKPLELEGFTYGFEYGLDSNCGELDHYNSQGQDGMDFGVLDGLLDELYEIDDHAANDISVTCEDFLPDVELAEKITDLGSALSGRNSSSESQSPGFCWSSHGAFGLLEPSNASTPESECNDGSVEKKSVECEFNDSNVDKWEYEVLARDDALMVSLDLENLNELNGAKPLESGISSDGNEKKASEAGKISNFLKQKKSHKPTNRLLEEFSSPQSNHLVVTEKDLATTSSDVKRLKVQTHEEHSQEALTCLPEFSSFSETITQGIPDDGDERLSGMRSKCIAAKRNLSSSSKDRLFEAESHNELNHVRELKSTSREESLKVTRTKAAYKSQPQPQPRRCRLKKLPPSHLAFDTDTASESEDDTAKKRKSKKGYDRRKNQRMWTSAEVGNLIDGIAQFGTGRWTDIKRDFFSLSAYRTPIDLRDKWRNLLITSCVEKHNPKGRKKEVEQKLKKNPCHLPKSWIRRIRELASLHPYPKFSPGGKYIRRKKK